MNKLAEEIWKTIWGSLLVVTILIGATRYVEREEWWKINVNQKDPDTAGPLIFYAVKGAREDDDQINSQIFVKSSYQESSLGKYGVFENILPGQSVFIQINSEADSIKSPSFIVRGLEKRLVLFEEKDGRLYYLGSSSKIRTAPVAKNIFPNNEKNAPNQLQYSQSFREHKPTCALFYP